MKLCTTLTFDGDPTRLAAHVRGLEAAGVDIVLIPEIYGFDQVSVLGFVAATTTRIGLMTGMVNVYSRSPSLIAPLRVRRRRQARNSNLSMTSRSGGHCRAVEVHASRIRSSGPP